MGLDADAGALGTTAGFGVSSNNAAAPGLTGGAGTAALFGEEIAGLSEDMLLAVTEDAPTTPVERRELLQGLELVELLVRTGLAKSKGEARRTIDQGGAYVNNLRVPDSARQIGAADLLHDRYIVLRKGRRDVHIVQAT